MHLATDVMMQFGELLELSRNLSVSDGSTFTHPRGRND